MMRHALALPLLASSALAASPSYSEDFSAPGSLGGWGGGSTYLNPGSGGVGGASDGYVSISNSFPANLGIADFSGLTAGNYPADGIGGVSFWINDVNAPDNFEIRFSIGQAGPNHWQYNPGFVPPHNAWRKIYISLHNPNPAHWTQTHGAGSLAEALASVVRINIRHDLPPFGFFPDPIAGDLGFDRVRLHPVCPGETNGDDLINFADLNTVLSNFGSSGVGIPGDVNNDGVVNFADLNIVLSNFGADCTPPTPQ